MFQPCSARNQRPALLQCGAVGSHEGNQGLENVLLYAPLNAWMGDSNENVTGGAEFDPHIFGQFVTDEREPQSALERADLQSSSSWESSSSDGDVSMGSSPSPSGTPISIHAREVSPELAVSGFNDSIKKLNTKANTDHAITNSAIVAHYNQLMESTKHCSKVESNIFKAYWAERLALVQASRNNPIICLI